MSLLKNLATDSSIQGEKDSLGGSLVDSGLYDLEIKLAYLTIADSGAMAMNIVVDNAGRESRYQFYMTSGTEKGCKNYYVNKSGDKAYLPGFLMANSLSLLTVGKEIADLEPEDKTIKLYNKEAQAEIPTSVKMWMELIGQKITAGILKQVVDKTSQNPTTKKYEPTGETREENEIVKFFRHDDGLTVPEIEAGETEAKFKEAWDAKYTGTVRNKAKGTGVKSGSPSGASGNQPRTSMFAKK